MTKVVSAVNDLVWGAPALLMILGVGLYLSLRLAFVQLRLLPHALRVFFSKLRPGRGQQEASSFQALCTALGATVGTGNLVGVAGAICIGGPGAVFWMWLCGLLGMVTKYAEAVLAVRYRVPKGNRFWGGPMYVITQGLGARFLPLAKAYCLFGLAAAFGVGNATQINAVITGVNGLVLFVGGTPSFAGNLTMGFLLAVMVGALLLGGARRIGAAAEKLVPFAAAGYILLCLAVLMLKWDRVGTAFGQILTGAFSPKAATGGALGSAFQALRIGCSRGVFTNEAGMGTAAIAHGEAKVDHPAQQGLMGIIEVFLDTIVICTLTALVILVSGIPIPYGLDKGAQLAMDAFCSVCGKGAAVLIVVMLACFAIATVLGWGLYGARCAQFLFGDASWKAFALTQAATVLFSSVLETGIIWQFSEMMNGLMVIPNLIALAALSPEISRLTKDYTKNRRKNAGGGSYANLYQCKPL